MDSLCVKVVGLEPNRGELLPRGHWDHVQMYNILKDHHFQLFYSIFRFLYTWESNLQIKWQLSVIKT